MEQPGSSADFEVIYQELHRLARARLAIGGRNTVLDTTALVHEAFLKLQSSATPLERTHFLNYAARAMRSIVIDAIRMRQAERHGGDHFRVTFDPSVGLIEDSRVLAVHEALEDLQRLDPRLAQVVEMRYFAGLTEAEVALALGLSERTVRRDWEKARLLLAERFN
jgi:RNA polymerase sigma factor (TIGR02999 family)